MSNEQLDTLVERINAEAEWAEAYAASEEGSHAEFCQSLGYGDGEPEINRYRGFANDELELLESLRKKMKRREFNELITANCSLEYVGNIRSRDCEVYSVPIGELEHQLSDELSEQLEALTDDEFEYVSRRADCYIDKKSRSFIYCNMEYSRWSLILDVEQLKEGLTHEA